MKTHQCSADMAVAAAVVCGLGGRLLGAEVLLLDAPPPRLPLLCRLWPPESNAAQLQAGPPPCRAAAAWACAMNVRGVEIGETACPNALIESSHAPQCACVLDTASLPDQPFAET